MAGQIDRQHLGVCRQRQEQVPPSVARGPRAVDEQDLWSLMPRLLHMPAHTASFYKPAEFGVGPIVVMRLPVHV